MTDELKTLDALVVAADIDGSWIVQEDAGVLLRRFPSYHAARKFVERARRSPSTPSTVSLAEVLPRLNGKLTLGSTRKTRSGHAHES